MITGGRKGQQQRRLGVRFLTVAEEGSGRLCVVQLDRSVCKFALLDQEFAVSLQEEFFVAGLLP